MSTVSRIPEERSDAENRWVSFQPYLQSKGYQLRPRYHPDWVPSWIKTGSNPLDCEDATDVIPIRTLDAVRAQDQLQVVIKMLTPSNTDREGEEELEILQHFNSSPLNEDPANHVTPCLDSFPIPGVAGGMFFVMPLLSDYKDPPFQNLAEIHDFLTQIFEVCMIPAKYSVSLMVSHKGLDFLHRHDVAHCDIAPANIMMDKRPLYNESFHPFHQQLSLDGNRPLWPKYSRSRRPVRYYYIDFGYAKWFKDPSAPRALVGIHAKERVPEQLAGTPYDPFKADIFQLGAILRRDLIPKYKPLGFLLPLARDMTSPDPQKRPNIQIAQQNMHIHFAGVAGWRTRWPIVAPGTPFQKRVMFIISGLALEALVFLKRILGIFVPGS
ncbi:kinase domain protein [Ceratobasidium sp. AG-Ba]|nr:kinase domain protein [Ceratobasidium sp. AG-Ba]